MKPTSPKDSDMKSERSQKDLSKTPPVSRKTSKSSASSLFSREPSSTSKHAGRLWGIVFVLILLLVVLAILFWPSKPAEQVQASVEETVEDVSERLSPADGTLGGMEYVNLGLSVKWAVSNIGASAPYEVGNAYAWGETKPKSGYIAQNSETHNREIWEFGGDPKRDAAAANLGEPWRLPTKAEVEELFERCSVSWGKVKGQNGLLLTSENGKSLFLPAGGQHYEREVHWQGACGYYWTSTPHENNLESAYCFDFDSGNTHIRPELRVYGINIRPVAE